MTSQEFLRILRFYLDCIEAEDRHSLTTSLSALHHSLVSPWDDEEPFFHPANAEVIFEAGLPSDQNLLLGGALHPSGAERFFYGYPVFLDNGGFLSPLFVAEVDVQHNGGISFSMRHAHTAGDTTQSSPHPVAARHAGGTASDPGGIGRRVRIVLRPPSGGFWSTRIGHA